MNPNFSPLSCPTGVAVSKDRFFTRLWARANGRSERARLAIRGSVWSAAGYVCTQLLRTAATVVLARYLLGPEVFGVVGLISVFLAGLAMFSELGILANVVQHPQGDDLRFLNTAFSIQAGRGAFIWIASLVAAYPLALFYGEPQLAPLLGVAGFSEMIRGLASTSVCTLTRHVNLRKLTILTISSEFVATGVCIVWALSSPSPWAIVIRSVVSAVVYAAGSHAITGLRVRFGWDRSAARDILQFGGWISIATATYFLSGQGERLILGKFVTPAELGCFSLAIMISSMPAAGISQLVNQIILPILSRSVRMSNVETLRDFLRARKLFSGAAVFTGLGFLVLGKPLVALLLPPKFAMTGWMLQALGVRVALDVFAAPASTLILASGKSVYSAAASTVRLILMGVGIAISLVFFGLPEAILSLLCAQALSYLPMIYGLSRVLPGVASAELRYYCLVLLLLGMTTLAFWRVA